MRRVYFIYAAKRIARGAVFPAGALLLTLAAGSSLVSIQHIAANMPNVLDFPALSHFFFSAFLKTRLAVQLLAILAVASAAFLLKDVFAAVEPVRRKSFA